jgi:hypothetical protein
VGEADTNGVTDVFVRDRQEGTTERVSNGGTYPSISSDGRFVAYYSGGEIFVRDRQMGTTQWLTRAISYGAYSGPPSISSDGRFVAFSSPSPNVVAGDTNGYEDSFVIERSTGAIERVSVNGCGVQTNGKSFGPPSISSDGRYVAFSSEATNLVADDTNGARDYFVRDRSTPHTNECIAPTTTASAATSSGAGYISGTPTNKNVTVSLSAQDNEGGSGIRNIRYSATGADPFSEQTVAAADLPAKVTIDAEGITTVSYFATDNAGNQESPVKTFTVDIDRSAPDASITSGPSGPTRDTTPTFSFGGSDNLTPTSVILFSYKVVPDGAAPESVNWSTYAPYYQRNSVSLGGATGLAQGSYTFYLKAQDQAGNEDASPAQRSFTVDTTAPTVNSMTPQSGTTGVGLATNLTATFSEKMTATSINKTTFKLYRVNSDGTQTQITNVAVSLSSDGLKAKLNPFGVQTPTLLLARNTKYKGVLTTGATDLAGNSLAQQKSWTFTTKP